MPRIDAIPVAQLAGEPVHGLLDGHERPAGEFCVPHVTQQAQAHVVERHVAQVCTGVREPHLDTGITGELLEHLGPMVGDGGAPPQRPTVFEHQIEEGVHRVQAAAQAPHRSEGLADHGLVGAGDDLGVEEVTVPHPHPESAVVVLAETSAVALVAHQLVALDLVAQVQGGRARAELLEHDQIDAVGVHLERYRQVLPPEVAAEAVDQPGEWAQDVDRDGVGLDVGRREQTRFQRVAHRPQRLRCLRQEVQRVLDVRPGLQHPVGPAQQRFQPAQLTWLGVGRRQGSRPAHVSIELVEKQLLRGHSDESGAQRLDQHPFHPCLLSSGGTLVLAGGAVQSHCRGAHVGVPEERRHIGPERARLQRGDVLLTACPVLVLLDRLDDEVARDRLDSAEDVTGIGGVEVHRGQRTRAEQHCGDPVAQRLRQRRAAEHFDVVVSVDVDHAGQHPLVGGVDHLCVGLVEIAGDDRGDVAVADADGAHGRRGAGAVEPAAVADDRVVRHITHTTHRTARIGGCQRHQ